MEIRVELKLQLAKYSYNLLYTNDNNFNRAKNTIYRRDVALFSIPQLKEVHYLNYQIQT